MSLIKAKEIKEMLTFLCSSKEVENYLAGNPNKSLGNPSIIKPSGYWISVNFHWERFCKENPRMKLKGYTLLNVVINKDLRIFMLNNIEDLKTLAKLCHFDLDFSEKKFSMNEAERIELSTKIEENGPDLFEGIYLTEQGIEEYTLRTAVMWDIPSIVLFNKEGIRYQRIKEDYAEKLIRIYLKVLKGFSNFLKELIINFVPPYEEVNEIMNRIPSSTYSQIINKVRTNPQEVSKILKPYTKGFIFKKGLSQKARTIAILYCNVSDNTLIKEIEKKISFFVVRLVRIRTIFENIKEKLIYLSEVNVQTNQDLISIILQHHEKIMELLNDYIEILNSAQNQISRKRFGYLLDLIDTKFNKSTRGGIIRINEEINFFKSYFK